MIHMLPKFHEMENENPHCYQKEFYMVYLSIKPQEITNEQIKLVAFLYILPKI